MLNSSITILTAVVMLLHSQVGCCMHHSHACEHGHFHDVRCTEHTGHASANGEAITGTPDADHDRHRHDDSPCHDERHNGHGDVCHDDHSLPAVLVVEEPADYETGVCETGDQAARDQAARDQAARDQETGECPECPCSAQCEGDDCTFSHTSRVKIPSLDEFGLGLSMSVLNAGTSLIAGQGRNTCADTGPPEGVVACLCRPMLQVWRL